MKLTRAILLLGLCMGSDASAQAAQIFGTGKPYEYRETQLDQRFKKTRFYRALGAGADSQPPECLQLLGGMFTLLGEAAPSFHAIDDNFFLAPAFAQALQQQLSLPYWPGVDYFRMMVRQVMLEKRLPPEWLDTADQVNKKTGVIDMAKLRFLADGVRPIDSIFATLPMIIERHKIEVDQANSAAAATAEAAFKDDYRDHVVLWTGLVLMDLKREGGRKGRHSEDADAPVYVATLEYRTEVHKEISKIELPFFNKKKRDPVYTIEAHLAAKQYTDLKRLPRESKVMVRGLFSDYSKGFLHFVMHDAILFEDRDTSHGVILAQPEAIARCGIATNDLQGLAPQQPGGFAH